MASRVGLPLDNAGLNMVSLLIALLRQIQTAILVNGKARFLTVVTDLRGAG
jgi:hypothetical protein